MLYGERVDQLTILLNARFEIVIGDAVGSCYYPWVLCV